MNINLTPERVNKLILFIKSTQDLLRPIANTGKITTEDEKTLIANLSAIKILINECFEFDPHREIDAALDAIMKTVKNTTFNLYGFKDE